MCGIAGFVSNKREINFSLTDLGKRFCNILRHRGPDYNGIWIDDEKSNLVSLGKWGQWMSQYYNSKKVFDI